MRLWSIHPSYLDVKGLVALWREGLLALHVLEGKTRGYTNHPQLQRFQLHLQPIFAITAYLHGVADEADIRGYAFNREKLPSLNQIGPLVITSGQVEFEVEHLKSKLALRDPVRGKHLENQVTIKLHPVFVAVEGPVSDWEKGRPSAYLKINRLKP